MVDKSFLYMLNYFWNFFIALTDGSSAPNTFSTYMVHDAECVAWEAMSCGCGRSSMVVGSFFSNK